MINAVTIHLHINAIWCETNLLLARVAIVVVWVLKPTAHHNLGQNSSHTASLDLGRFV